MLDENTKSLVDVGTDHAYLPIYLAKNKKLKSIMAVDCLKGPLLNAEKNIKKYRVENIVKTKLLNGLDGIDQQEVDAVIIAGMGSENIIKIIDNAKWLKNANKTLILQPMTRENLLREYLLKNNYKIEKESIILDKSKIYVVIKAKYEKDCSFKNTSPNIYPYVGSLLNGPITKETKLYLKVQIIKLNKVLNGVAKNKDEISKINKAKLELEQILKSG